jgi:hypothetical protein
VDAMIASGEAQRAVDFLEALAPEYAKYKVRKDIDPADFSPDVEEHYPRRQMAAVLRHHSDITRLHDVDSRVGSSTRVSSSLS